MVRRVLPRRRAIAVMSGVALSTPYLASGIARAADTWPNKPVRYINLFPAGGATDVLSRVVCAQLTELSGQQFIVENKGGSGGNVGADAIAKSPNDGYTIGLMSIATHAIAPTLYEKLPFDAEKDFTPVSMLWEVPNILVVKPEVPAKTIPELVALCKANPGKYTFGSGGSGTSPHLCGEMLKQQAGINMQHVPYRGGAPALQDLLSGNIDSMWDNIPGPLAHVKTGRLRPLGVTSLKPSPVAPDVLPMSNYYPGFQITSWGALCGPAGLPAAMVERASELCKKALQSEALKTAFLGQGATEIWRTPAETADYRRAQEKALAPVIKASGAKVG